MSSCVSIAGMSLWFGVEISYKGLEVLCEHHNWNNRSEARSTPGMATTGNRVMEEGCNEEEQNEGSGAVCLHDRTEATQGTMIQLALTGVLIGSGFMGRKPIGPRRKGTLAGGFGAMFSSIYPVETRRNCNTTTTVGPVMLLEAGRQGEP